MRCWLVGWLVGWLLKGGKNIRTTMHVFCFVLPNLLRARNQLSQCTKAAFLVCSVISSVIFLVKCPSSPSPSLARTCTLQR